MLYLYRSNRLDWLAERLNESLNSQKFSHPLQGHRVIIPNRDNMRWLQFQLASLNEITANIDYQLPAEWMWNEIRKLYPVLPETLATDLDPLRWPVMDLISEDKITESATVLRNYIDVSDTERRLIRCWQLSGLIASVFDKYLVHRPGMITAWDNDRLISDHHHERWQKDLWKNLKQHWDTIYDDVSGYSRTDLQQELLLKIKSGETESDTITPLNIFHPGKLPEPLVRLIAAYSEKYPVHLFTCRLTDPLENELPENVYLEEMLKEEIYADKSWNHFLSGNASLKVESHFERNENDTFLNTVQNCLFLQDIQGKRIEPDDTLHVHSCHSPLREVEILHEFLLEYFEKSGDIRPDEIAVVSPSMDEYVPFIHAVFGNSDGSVPRIPYSLAADVHGQKDLLANVFKRMIEMIDGRWHAADILEVLHNKPVMDKFEFNESDIAEIRNWIIGNNVTWGIDHTHRKEYKQPGNTTNTFTAALNRLWTGSIFDLSDFQFINETPPFYGLDSSDSNELLGKFSEFIHRLKDIYLQTHSVFTVSEWCEKALTWMDAIFPSDSGDYPFYELAESIQSVSEESKLAGYQNRIPFDIFRSRLKSKIETGYSSSISFTGGVLFSPMVPLRNLPHKVVAMIGLNEENFPRNITAPEFDLIQYSPLPRDTTVKDEDRHLFIQYVMAATQKLFISYIGRSAEDNEEIPPSVILEKWMDIIQDRTGVSKKKLISEHSLHGFTGKALDAEKTYSETYSKVALSILEGTGKNGLYTDNKLSESDGKKEVTVSDLESFFRHPLKFFLQKNFGAYLSDFDDNLGKEYFTDDGLLNYRLAAPSINWFEHGTDPALVKKLFIQSGAAPDGFPGDLFTDSVIINSQNVLEAIHEKSGSDQKNSIGITTELGNIQLNGMIDTYLKDGYVDFFLSSKNGKSLIVAWIRYLLLLYEYGVTRIENHILFNAKKDENDWISFKEVEDAASVLSKFVRIYQKGIHKPFYFAPVTAFDFTEALNGDDFNRAVRKAETKWFGNQYVFPESDDPVYSLWFGRKNPLEQTEFLENAKMVFNDLILHLE